jgi:hypothetical protein
MWQRHLYFLLVGWWAGRLWAALASVIGLLLVTLPLTIWMYNRIGSVITLHRH